MTTISLTNEDNMHVWMFHPSGVYSVRSFCAVVNNGGITPVHTPAIWKLSIPPRIHVFLWLLADKKTLTRDNLHKRRHDDDRSCLFCSEPESVDHLFFKCFVVQQIWEALSTIFKVQLGSDFESIARWWVSNNKHAVLNIFCSGVLWSFWSLRNEMCLQGRSWLGMDMVWGKVIGNIRTWRILCADVHSGLLDRNLLELEKMRGELLRIAWK
jgi:hypothetical protein